MRFKGPEHALRWAFTMHRKAHYASVNLFDSRSTDPQGMTIWDAHAQAALFIRQLDELPQDERAAMYAAFAIGDLRRHAITALGVSFGVFVGAGLSKELLRDIVANLITRRPQIRTMAKKYQTSYRQIVQARKRIEQVWLPIHLRAIDALSARWQDHFR